MKKTSRKIRVLLASALAGVMASTTSATAASSITQGVPISSGLLQSSLIPIQSITEAFLKAGWGAVWKAHQHVWALLPPKEAIWHTDGRVAARSSQIRVMIGGKLVGSMSMISVRDPVTGHTAVYVSLYRVQALFERLGMTSSWQDGVWDLTELSTQLPSAPSLPENGILSSYLVAVAGQVTSLTDDIRINKGADLSSGLLAVSLPGESLPITSKKLLTRTVAGRTTENVLRFSFAVPASVAAGDYPVSVRWTFRGVTESYRAVLSVPALFIAEQGGVYEDNMLGHRLYPPGKFKGATDPKGIVFDPVNQLLYVSNGTSNAIDVYNTSGVQVTTLAPLGMNDPGYLALNASQGRLFVSNSSNTQTDCIMQLTVGGKVIPFPHADFSAVFGLGNGMVYDPQNQELFVTRELTSNQYASGSSAVVAYDVASGQRIHLSNAFTGLGSDPTGIAYNPKNHGLYVSGHYDQSPKGHHYVVTFRPNGTRISVPGAFAIGETNTGDANAIVYDTANGLIAVVGDSNLHFFTPAGAPVPPLTSNTSSATPLGGLGNGGTVAAAVAY